MTYIFPSSLHLLRDHLRAIGCDVNAFASARQAAFMAQQLIGSRIKFPSPGADMTSTLFLIQKAIPQKGAAIGSLPQDLFSNRTAATNGSKSAKKGRAPKPGKPRPAYLDAFDADAVRSGYHVFADGACVPNPGPGGWGFVVYKDGQEMAFDCGGEPEATNNTMELTALLHAIRWALQYPALAITVWCDSQYAVKGANEWRHGWKAKGWRRGGADAKEKNQHLANRSLWISIDEALTVHRTGVLSIRWIKGHAGHVGNERADELAEMGRMASLDDRRPVLDDLDTEYRAVMAG